MTSHITPGAWLSSRLASQTNSGYSSPSSIVSTSQTATGHAVETVLATKDGHTVYVTVSLDSTPTVAAQVDSESSNGSTPTGAIAGGVIGALAVAGLALFAFWFFRRKRLVKRERRATLPPPYTEPDMSEQLHRGESCISRHFRNLP